MNYKTVSIENVIGRVIRNTKLTDTSAIQDIYEWIPEAMELLETQQQLEPRVFSATINFHQAKLPCGLVYIKAVEYQGSRLNFSNVIRERAPNAIGTQTLLQSVPVLQTNPATGNSIMGWTLEQVKQAPLNAQDYYYLKPNFICTSMKSAHVCVYYDGVALDENGFPMIPDNGNYKQALYWYVRGMLIGSGQLNDKNNSEESCRQLFELYGGRAINEITYPSVDKMEMIRANQVRYNISENYWDNFNRA